MATRAFAALVFCALLGATNARAQTTYVWQDTTTSWTTPAAWSPVGPANWNDNQLFVDALASFGSRATINNQPIIDNTIVVRGVSIDNSQAAWNLASPLTPSSPTRTWAFTIRASVWRSRRRWTS